MITMIAPEKKNVHMIAMIATEKTIPTRTSKLQHNSGNTPVFTHFVLCNVENH